VGGGLEKMLHDDVAAEKVAVDMYVNLVKLAAQEGDVVTVFGGDLPAAIVASSAGTIAYELFCRVGRRVPRIYLRDGRPVAIGVTAGSRTHAVAAPAATLSDPRGRR